jgi:hypothetical protein
LDITGRRFPGGADKKCNESGTLGEEEKAKWNIIFIIGSAAKGVV